MKYQETTGGQYRAIPEQSDRMRAIANTRYTPERLTAIIRAADAGDIESLALCGAEMLSRNWDVIAAMEQRTDALCGCEWTVSPGGDTPRAAEAAKAFEQALRGAGKNDPREDTFYDLCAHLMDAVVMPFIPSEIIWGPGGTLKAFQNLETWQFDLRDGFVPRLVTDEFPSGLPEDMQRDKFIFHQFRKKSDPARQGKIRVLAWLHCFQNWPIKDLFSFIERFGMPFVVAKVDQNAWENERQVLHQIIRSFGPSGGGVFTKNTELELLNAANTGGDNVYFRALEFTRSAIYTLIVGQLASSSDSSGMSNGDAQTAVRQDILEADARALEATIYAQVAVPWTRFQFGPDVAPPELKFQVEPPEDQTKFATVVNVLSQAGFKADAAELSERFGLKLTYAPQQQQGLNGLAMSADLKPARSAETKKMQSAVADWLGPLEKELARLADGDDGDAAAFGAALAKLAQDGKFGPSGDFETLLENTCYTGVAAGMAAGYKRAGMTKK